MTSSSQPGAFPSGALTPDSLLIGAAALAAVLAHVVILDVRYRLGGPPGLGSYREGHIPGATFVDMDTTLAGPPGPGRHPLPAAREFQAAMRGAGVSEGTSVVVYDDGDGLAASRAWWTLRYFGHAQVRVLDGGFAAWTSAGFPVTTDASAAAEGDFTARPGGMPVVDAAGAAAIARDGVLIDVRAPERFRGEHEPIDPVAGHIPGAVNVPITSTAGPGGVFKSPDALREVFAAVGATPPAAPPSAATAAPAAIGVYCGSGVTAARGVLALALAGIPAALYVGSWSDWITDPSRPVATL